MLAICGIPGFSGFFSKDQVIYGTLVHGYAWLYALGIVTAGITSYYMCRLFFVTFLGTYRGDVDPSALGMRHPELAGTSAASHDADHVEHAQNAQWFMIVPVAALIPFTVFAGWLMFGGENSPWMHFFEQQFPHPALAVPAVSETLTTWIVLAVVAVGIGIAYIRYATAGAQINAVPRLRNESIHMPAILSNAFYFDAALDWLFVKPSEFLGRFFARWLDPHLIDGAVRETVFSAQWLGALTRSFQTGLMRSYAFILVFGAACFVVYYAIVAGGFR